MVDKNNNNVIEIICGSVLQTSHFRKKKNTTPGSWSVNEENPTYKRVNAAGQILLIRRVNNS